MKKSIFLFFAAILCAMSANAKTIYLKPNSNWTQANAWFAVCLCNGSEGTNWHKMTKSTADPSIYQVEIADAKLDKTKNQNIIFVRMDPAKTALDWASKWNQTGDLDITKLATNNCCAINSGQWDCGTNVTWSTYTPPTEPVIPDYYIAGNDNFVGADKAWKEKNDALKMTYNETNKNYTFTVTNVAADKECQFKVTNGTWSTTWGGDAVSPAIDGVTKSSDGNVVFTLSTGGDVTVTFDGTNIQLTTTGEIKVAIPDRYITGTPNLVGGTGWGANEVLMTYNEESKLHEHTFTALAAGDYEFKITDGTWSNSWGKNGQNYPFNLPAAGDVTIKYNWKDNSIELILPEVTEPEPDPAETETVYFVNAEDWTGTIYAYAWTDGTPEVKNHDWPGVAATKEANKIGGHDVYSYTAEKGKYAKVIFNNNSGNQTSDMTWAANQYLCKNEWCADEAAVLAKLNGPVEYVSVYFINTVDWSAVNIYTWSPEIAKWPGVAMTKEAEQIAGFDVYSYTVEKGTTFGGMKFNENGGNQTGDLQWNAGKYYIYNYGPVIGWFTKEEAIANLTEPVVTYDYYIAGNEALLGADKNWGSTPAGKGMDKGADGLYTATFTLSANTEYEFKITDGQWNSESDNSHEHTTLAAVYVGVTGGNGNNIKVNLAEAKELTITFNSTEDKIYFNLDEETASLTYRVQVPEGTEACYIAGPCNSWAFREMTREGTTDIFTIDIVGAKETDEYKYACQADWAYAEVIDGGGNRTTWQELDQVEEWGKPVIVTYQLKGVGGWEQPGIELVQNPGNDKEYMLTCQAISATDAIKVVRLENGEIKDYYGNGTVKDGVAVAVNYDGAGNITLPEGTYNFYFDTNEPEKKLWIEAATDCEPTPDYTRTVGNNQFGTICLPFGGTITGAVLYQCVGRETGKVYLGSVNTLTAGVPYIFQATATELAVYSDGTTAAAGSSNGLHGTFNDETVVAAGNYILLGNALRPSNGEAKVNANRAYLVMSEVPAGKPQEMPGRRYIGMSVQGENVETGVEDIITTDAPVKVIENGQLIIIRDGVKYNVQGQKL